jgi:hypothetical protein
VQTFESKYARAIGPDPLAFSMGRAPRNRALPYVDVANGVNVGTVEVRANHGRWIVLCPVCGGAELASETVHRFVCIDCGAGPFETVWPADREQIEAVLMDRPEENRNWFPGETVDELVAENEEHL